MCGHKGAGCGAPAPFPPQITPFRKHQGFQVKLARTLYLPPPMGSTEVLAMKNVEGGFWKAFMIVMSAVRLPETSSIVERETGRATMCT